MKQQLIFRQGPLSVSDLVIIAISEIICSEPPVISRADNVLMVEANAALLPDHQAICIDPKFSVPGIDSFSKSGNVAAFVSFIDDFGNLLAEECTFGELSGKELGHTQIEMECCFFIEINNELHREYEEQFGSITLVEMIQKKLILYPEAEAIKQSVELLKNQIYEEYQVLLSTQTEKAP